MSLSTRLSRCAVVLGGATLVVASVATASSAAADPVGTDPAALAVASTNLTPLNGWHAYGAGTRNPAASKSGGVVTLQGAIATSGTNSQAFVLPAAFRPAKNVYVYVDLCNATNGRLLIQTNGAAFVQAGTSFANAQCFTSLEGASFAVTTSGFTNLTLINSWIGAQFGTAAPAAKVTNGIVTLKGSLSTSGTNSEPFVLPKAFRPKTNVYVKVDMCNATNGRLIISPDGSTFVQAESNFANAQCFTSLDGVSYAVNTNTWTGIPTVNGWTAGGFSTRAVAGKLADGVVHLAGSIQTTGTNTQPFRLPGALRPTATLYVPTDMCGATNGRIIISTNGFVNVAAETDFSNAQCFVSLEGVVFHRT